MGPEKNSKKRKAAAPDDEVAKVKKVKQMVADVPPKKSKAALRLDSITTKKLNVPQPSLLEDAPSKSAKETHPTQTTNPKFDGTNAILKKPKFSSDVETTKKKPTEAHRGINSDNNLSNPEKLDLITETPVNDDDEATSATEDSEEEEIDDQTEALLKGFESDDDRVNDPEEQGYEVGNEIPKVDKKIRKKVKEAAEKASASGKPGVVYIGRIPHGFYEQEMRQYFSQFGTITNLRLSRNRKTGKSKHFAFVEFESAEVAEIVSKTMDNYLLFGHILKCKLVAPEQVHENLWVGANKRFKSVPWNKLQGRQLSQAMMVSGWERRMAKEEKRRADKKAAMNLMDYDFESPQLKSAKDVLKKSQQALAKPVDHELDEESESSEGPPKTIEAPKKTANQAMTVKSKKNKTEKNGTATAAAAKLTSYSAEAAKALLAVPAEPSSKKKDKKAKSSDKLVDAEELEKFVSAKDTDTGSVGKVENHKKSKKNKKNKM